MSPTKLIFKQNRQRQTPITIMSPLQIRITHTTHLFNCTNINTHLKVMDLLTAPIEVGHLLVEWRGPPVNQQARMPARWGIPSAGVRRDGCSTPPLLSVEGWGRPIQHQHATNFLESCPALSGETTQVK